MLSYRHQEEYSDPLIVAVVEGGAGVGLAGALPLHQALSLMSLSLLPIYQIVARDQKHRIHQAEVCNSFLINCVITLAYNPV